MDKYEQMLNVAKTHPNQEVCGFVAKLQDGIEALNGNREFLIPVRNVHWNPEHNFAMHYEFQKKVLNDPSVIVTGMYHSHNHGSERPSFEDRAARPTWPGTENWNYYIIFQGQEVWDWKFFPGGEIIGHRVAVA